MLRRIEEGDTKGGIIIPKGRFKEFVKFQRRWVEKMIETNVIYYGDNIAEPKTRKLIPNPASPEMPMMEILMEMAYNSRYAVRLSLTQTLTGFAYPQNVSRNSPRRLKNI